MATRKKYKIVLSEKYVRKSENGKEWFQFPVNISGQLVAIQTIIPLDPYTEPDLEQVRKEAYDKGYETAKHECEDCTKSVDNGKAYQKGLSDAWEAARKIVLPGDVSGIYLADLEEIFDRSSLQDVIKDYSASECIEKIRQYEQEKKEIKVGDEIEAPSGLKGYVVNFTDDELVHYVSSEGRFGTMGTSAVSKTGRHFPEIAEVLAKMKEANNG